MQLQADCWMAVFASRWGLVNVNIGLALLLGSSWLCCCILLCVCLCVCACRLTRSAGNVTAVLVSSVSRPGFFQRTADFYWVSAVDRPYGGPGSLF